MAELSGTSCGAAAALAALHLAEPRPEALARPMMTSGLEALDFCHHAGLTLLVRDVLPAATARDAANNLLRLRVLEETYRRLAGLPVDFVALKGITQCALFGIRPRTGRNPTSTSTARGRPWKRRATP